VSIFNSLLLRRRGGGRKGGGDCFHQMDLCIKCTQLVHIFEFWSRFHPACINMNAEEAKRLDHFFCENCSSESQKKLQNSHNASRHSDTKVFTFGLKIRMFKVEISTVIIFVFSILGYYI
jgi:hypothetical protein